MWILGSTREKEVGRGMSEFLIARGEDFFQENCLPYSDTAAGLSPRLFMPAWLLRGNTDQKVSTASNDYRY